MSVEKLLRSDTEAGKNGCRKKFTGIHSVKSVYVHESLKRKCIFYQTGMEKVDFNDKTCNICQKAEDRERVTINCLYEAGVAEKLN